MSVSQIHIQIQIKLSLKIGAKEVYQESIFLMKGTFAYFHRPDKDEW